MTKKAKILLSATLSAGLVALPIATVSCSSQAISQKTGSYADSLTKLAGGDITLAGAWSDARFYAGDEQENIIAVGATDYIANDGIQANKNLSAKDVAAVQKLFIDTINLANTKNEALTIKDPKGKTKSVFNIYNHDGYSVVDPSAKIKYNINGDTHNASAGTLSTEPAKYLDIVDGKVVMANGGKNNINIKFIPSADPTYVGNATKKLSDYFKSIGLTNIVISQSTAYDIAAAELEKGTIQIAFLPVNTWVTSAPNSNFIIVAGRRVQIVDPYKSVTNTTEPLWGMDKEKELVEAFNEYKKYNTANGKNSLYIGYDAATRPTATAPGYPESLKAAVDAMPEETLPTVGYYRSYIYARKDSEIAKLIMDAMKTQGSKWKLKWADVKDKVIYGFTSTTSSASFVYPEAWFKAHFEGFDKLLDL